MKVPIYNSFERSRAITDGNSEIIEFNEFVSTLLKNRMLNHDTEYGVFTFLQANGTEELTDDQMKVVKMVVSRFEKDKCLVCGNPAEWYDLTDDDYENLCISHRK